MSNVHFVYFATRSRGCLIWCLHSFTFCHIEFLLNYFCILVLMHWNKLRIFHFYVDQNGRTEQAFPLTMLSFTLFRKKRKTSPPYRVILHNDNFNKREYVVQVLMKVIPGMTLDNAVNIMQEAHYNGLSVVIICSQADAEEHCMQLRGNGLLSSIEPASGGC